LPEIPIASVLVLSSLMQLVNVSRFNRAALSSLIIRIDDRAPAAFVSIRTSKVTLKKEFNEVSGFATSAREMNSVLVMDSISVTLNFIIASSVTLKSMFGNVYARIATDLPFLLIERLKRSPEIPLWPRGYIQLEGHAHSTTEHFHNFVTDC
jgi:hypothetical protein